MRVRMNRLPLLCLTPLVLAIQVLAQQQEFTPNELAATYVTGNRFYSSSLTLEADGHYSIKSADCTMEYFDSGTYVLSAGVLHLASLNLIAKRRGEDREINLLDPIERKRAFVEELPEYIKAESTLLPLRWSDRIYLIYEEDLSRFANAIKLGAEPRSELKPELYYGSFYLRQGDEQKKVSGSPSLPKGKERRDTYR